MKEFIPPVLWPLFEQSTLVGHFLVALGTAATILAPLIRTQVDRGNRGKRTASPWPARIIWLAVIVGVALIVTGSILTQRGAERNAAAQANASAQETRQKFDQANQEITKKLEGFSLQLHAAQQAETRKQAEEKIDSLKSDFDRWAEDFDKRRPAKQKQLEQAKSAALQKELQLSAESMPLFSYVIKFVQERAAAYAKKSGRQIRMEIPPLPDNFFAGDPAERYIRFSGGKAQWTFSVSAGVPAKDENSPQLNVSITNADGRGGSVYVNRVPRSERFVIGGNGVFLSPDVNDMFGQYGLGKFEPTVQEVFGSLIESQLAESP